MAIKNIINGTRILVLLAAMIISSVTFGQQITPEQSAQTETQWMKQNLGITGDQNKKVYDLFVSSARQSNDVSKSAGNVNDKRAKMQDIGMKLITGLSGILTTDQFQKYQQHMMEMAKQHH